MCENGQLTQGLRPEPDEGDESQDTICRSRTVVEECGCVVAGGRCVVHRNAGSRQQPGSVCPTQVARPLNRGMGEVGPTVNGEPTRSEWSDQEASTRKTGSD